MCGYIHATSDVIRARPASQAPLELRRLGDGHQPGVGRAGLPRVWYLAGVHPHNDLAAPRSTAYSAWAEGHGAFAEPAGHERHGPARLPPPSDLSGEAWAGTLDGREVTLRFGGTSYAGDVSVSDPVFGREGRWHARGRLNVDIELAGPQRTIMGTMGPDGETMAVTVNVLGSKDLQYATLRRVR